jgi:hypothetical protein
VSRESQHRCGSPRRAVRVQRTAAGLRRPLSLDRRRGHPARVSNRRRRRRPELP